MNNNVLVAAFHLITFDMNPMYHSYMDTGTLKHR